MKKLIWLLALIMTAAFVFCGCSNLHNTSSATNETQASSATEAPTEPVISKIGNLFFQTKQKKYPKDVQKVIAVLSNGTKDSYSFGAQYELQAYQNSRWVHVPLTIDTIWSSEEIIAFAGGTGEHSYPIAEEGSPLSPGRYRIVLSVTNDTTKEELNIAAEFTVE